MKRVLLVANHPAFNKNMLRWAEVLRGGAVCEPVVFSTSGNMRGLMRGMGIGGDVATLYPPAGLGWELETNDPTRLTATAPGRARSAIKAIAKGPLESVARTAHLVLAVTRNVLELRRQHRFLVGLLRRERIAAVLLSETSPAYGATVFVQAARTCGIPVVTTPIDHYGLKDHAELYLTDEVLNADRGLKRLVARMYPDWEMSYKGRRMLRIRLDLLLAYQWMGWASRTPWHMVGAWEGAVATTNAAMRDFYVAEGLSPDLLKVVGSPELDMMSRVRERAEAERIGLLRELGLDPHKPVILTGMVANHYLAGRPDAEYETYEELIEGWIKPLAAIRTHNVIVNLHPSQRVEDYRYIEQWGVRICQRDITSLVPLCDIYVACSSTSRLAIACGIPLVYYDVFRYSGAMPTLTFPGLQGTKLVTMRADLIDIMSRLTGDPSFYSSMRQAQQASSSDWGALDGRSGERLLALIDSISQRNAANE